MNNQNFNHIELVQFDLDGTLINSMPQLRQAVNKVLTDSGFAAATETLVCHWVGNGADMLVQRALTHVLGRTPNAEEQQHGRDAFDEAYADTGNQDIALYPGVINTLQQLKDAGKTLALVTNKPYRFVPAILASTGLDPYFSIILGGDSLAQKKPDPAPLLHVCQALGISPKRSMMVGDSENDVLAAQAAGMAVIGLTYGYNYGKNIVDCHPDQVMDNINGLLELLL